MYNQNVQRDTKEERWREYTTLEKRTEDKKLVLNMKISSSQLALVIERVLPQSLHVRIVKSAIHEERTMKLMH